VDGFSFIKRKKLRRKIMNKQKLRIGSLLGVIVLVGSLLIASAPMFDFGCDPAFVLQEGDIYTVLPTGIDDADNMQCAFDQAVGSGPGRTVKLNAATYYISRAIDVVNFDGSFVGAGKDMTIIRNLDDVPFPFIDEPFPHPEPVFRYPVLFRFYQDENGSPSTLGFSDMTIQVKGKSDLWSYHGLGPFDVIVAIEIVGKVTGVEDYETSTMNTSFENMGFEGEAGDFLFRGVNMVEGIYIHGEAFNVFDEDTGLWDVKYYKPLIGNHSVTDCTFRNAHTAIDPWDMSDSDFSVERSYFEDVDYAALLFNLSNSTVNISRNEINNPGIAGIAAVQTKTTLSGDPPGPNSELIEPSSILFSHNNIYDISGEADGIFVFDFSFFDGIDGLLDVIISNNKIALNDTFYGGIFGSGVQDSLVLNNKISGTGLAGIYMGIAGDSVSDCTLLGNNLQNLDAYIAPIWLGPGTSNCTVVGGSNKTNVLDQGIDNILVGVNNMQGNPLGPEIQDAMQQKMEMIKSMR
jgi:hypothetical protein